MACASSARSSLDSGVQSESLRGLQIDDAFQRSFQCKELRLGLFSGLWLIVVLDLYRHLHNIRAALVKRFKVLEWRKAFERGTARLLGVGEAENAMQENGRVLVHELEALVDVLGDVAVARQPGPGQECGGVFPYLYMVAFMWAWGLPATTSVV